jgi:FkbM family methyltransferase
MTYLTEKTEHNPETSDTIPDQVITSGEDQAFTFPSQIVQVSLRDKVTCYTVNIPKQELFRVNAIFNEHEYLVPRQKSHGGPLTVVDIGANVGLYAIYMKFFEPTSIIHCFEPASNTLKLLQMNLVSIPGINIYPYGLYNTDQEAIMNINRFNTGENSIKFNGENYTDSVRVPLKDAGTEFDKLELNHLDVLKIDTEGCEVEILESLGHRLCWIDNVLLEYHSEQERRQIDDLLGEFHVFGAKAGGLNRGIVKYINSRLLTT